MLVVVALCSSPLGCVTSDPEPSNPQDATIAAADAQSTGWPDLVSVTGVKLPQGAQAASFVVW